jgi:uncharacterized protein (DUF3084 family)
MSGTAEQQRDYLANQDAQRLAKVEQHLKDQDRKIDRIENKVDKLIEEFANLSGGKQAALWIAGFIATIGIIIASCMGFRK